MRWCGAFASVCGAIASNVSFAVRKSSEGAAYDMLSRMPSARFWQSVSPGLMSSSRMARLIARMWSSAPIFSPTEAKCSTVANARTRVDGGCDGWVISGNCWRKPEEMTRSWAARESERFWRSASAADCCACVPISAFAAVSTAFVLRTAERAPGYSVRLTSVAHASAWSVAWLQSKSLASGAAALSCVSVTKWGQIWEMWEGRGRDVGRDPNAPASA